MTGNDSNEPPPYIPGPNPGRVGERQQFQQPQQYGQPPQQQYGRLQQQQFQQPGQFQPPAEMQPWQPAPQQPMPMPYASMQPAPMIKPKNPGAAAVLSFLIPGVGQLMNGDIGLGILMMILTGIAYASLLVAIGFLLVPARYIWSIIQAYTKAKNWNVAHGIIS